MVSSEDRTLVGFVAAQQVSGAADRESVSVAELVTCMSFTFGFPNDEVPHGHPLFDAGLDYYQLREVENSSWLREGGGHRLIFQHHGRE